MGAGSSRRRRGSSRASIRVPPYSTNNSNYTNPYTFPPTQQPSRTNLQPQFVLNFPAQYPVPHQYGQNQRPLSPAQQPFPPRGAPLPPPKSTSELQQTKTIKNQVCLKKNTLKLVPSKNDPNKLIPHFVFDASAACSVTIFYMAQEDVSKKSKLTTIYQEPGPRTYYEKGLGQTFPPERGEDVYALDLSLYDEEEDLCRVTGDVTFPLIIRLESLTEKAVEEGLSLSTLEPGCPIPTWVQSQSTYACLKKEDNEWEARTVKQKIWVEGVSYVLQEIYGMYDPASSDRKNEKSDIHSVDVEGRECVICLAAPRDTTVMPCRHMCMCTTCAKELQRQQVSKCPICRDNIDSLLHIKQQHKKKPSQSADVCIGVED